MSRHSLRHGCRQCSTIASPREPNHARRSSWIERVRPRRGSASRLEPASPTRLTNRRARYRGGRGVACAPGISRAPSTATPVGRTCARAHGVAAMAGKYTRCDRLGRNGSERGAGGRARRQVALGCAVFQDPGARGGSVHGREGRGERSTCKARAPAPSRRSPPRDPPDGQACRKNRCARRAPRAGPARTRPLRRHDAARAAARSDGPAGAPGTRCRAADQAGASPNRPPPLRLAGCRNTRQAAQKAPDARRRGSDARDVRGFTS